MQRLNSFVKCILSTVLVVVALGCGGGGGGGGGGTLNDKPQVRAFNASPDSNPLHITITGAAGNSSTIDLEANLAYLDPASIFHEEKKDTYDLQVYDSTNGDSLQAVAFDFKNNEKYALVCYGYEVFGTAFSKRLDVAQIKVDLTSPVGNRANLIIFHGFDGDPGQDDPPPAIDFQNPGDNPQYSVTNVAWGTSSTLQVDSGSSLTFDARRNGTEKVYASSTPTLDAGGVYLVIVSGIENALSPQEPRITYFKLN